MKASVVIAMMLAQAALAQSTAFTYQGELSTGGVPANGTYDVRFRVYNAATGGSYFIPEVCVNDVAVVNGRFSATLDVPAAFQADALRYLEIAVRPDSGLTCSSSAGYTTLSPRQTIAATPRANRANVASSLRAADGSPNQILIAAPNGLSTLGTSSQEAPLWVQCPTFGATPGEGVRIQGTASDVSNLAYLGFLDSSGNHIGYVGDGSSGDHNVFLGSYLADVGLITPGGRVVTALSDGGLRLGTSSGDYRRFIVGGGNSDGFFYGSYPRFGDGVHLGYNYFADATGADHTIHPDGGTSRITAGYGTIALATAPAFGGAPVNRLVVDETGRVTVPSAAGALTVAAGQESLRIVRGTVNPGGLQDGSGWTALTGPIGTTTVTLTTPMAGIPTAVASPIGPAGRTAQVTVMSTSVIRVDTQLSGQPLNVPFNLIVVGPR